MDLGKFESSPYKGQFKALHTEVNARRSGADMDDISYSSFIKEKFGVDMGKFFFDAGIDPERDTIAQLMTLPDTDARWIIPEFIRESIKLGLRKAPIWPNIIASEESVKGLNHILPSINMSEASARKVAEGETIPLGSISYQDKKFSVYKIGKGMKLTDEVKQYCSLKVLSIFFEDFGVRLGQQMDVLAIDCLLNGEQANGSESAPLLGIANTTTGKKYSDFLYAWLRLARLGFNPSIILGGEAAATKTLMLDEFRLRTIGTPMANLNMKTPLPQSSDYYIHGYIPTNQEILLDKTRSIIKMTAIPLTMESERIVSNQTEATYVTTTIGFAKLMRESAMILDSSKQIVSGSTYDFPTWMNADAADIALLK